MHCSLQFAETSPHLFECRLCENSLDSWERELLNAALIVLFPSRSLVPWPVVCDIISYEDANVVGLRIHFSSPGAMKKRSRRGRESHKLSQTPHI